MKSHPRPRTLWGALSSENKKRGDTHVGMHVCMMRMDRGEWSHLLIYVCRMADKKDNQNNSAAMKAVPALGQQGGTAKHASALPMGGSPHSGGNQPKPAPTPSPAHSGQNKAIPAQLAGLTPSRLQPVRLTTPPPKGRGGDSGADKMVDDINDLCPVDDEDDEDREENVDVANLPPGLKPAGDEEGEGHADKPAPELAHGSEEMRKLTLNPDDKGIEEEFQEKS